MLRHQESPFLAVFKKQLDMALSAGFSDWWCWGKVGLDLGGLFHPWRFLTENFCIQQRWDTEDSAWFKPARAEQLLGGNQERFSCRFTVNSPIWGSCESVSSWAGEQIVICTHSPCLWAQTQTGSALTNSHSHTAQVLSKSWAAQALMSSQQGGQDSSSSQQCQRS